jgi:two-component system cell cycle sensor histidine kinase/response regulator CckA
MSGDALPGSRTPSTPKRALVRLLTGPPRTVLDDLANRSDAGMRVLFDHAASGLLLIDRSGRIARANPALRALLAEDVDLTAGTPAALIFTAEERAAAWGTVQALLTGRDPDRHITARLRLADPDPGRRADVGCRRIMENDGAISGLLMRITDITAQVRLETQLKQSRELEALGRLVGGVAHDFNNLLTVIMGAVELGQERFPDPAVSAELEQIRRSAERGATLVRNLLALGRQQYLQAAPLDVNAALQSFASEIRSALGRNIALDVVLEQPGRRIRADPGQLDQVLTNLALNARAAMPDGGTLTLRSGRYVTITVQDTGCGIPPELLGRIFDPFFTTRRAQGGSGLGLATAHGIIRQSGGFLTVESTVGKGTAFRIYLPREEAEAEPLTAPDTAIHGAAPLDRAPADQAAAGPEPAHAIRNVLLVDDEPAVRQVTARALKRQGWTVLEADSAEAALALLDDDPKIGLTALVSDVVMPGRDGAALVDDIQARYPGLPAILVSGYAEAMLAERGTHAGGFLGKPYSPKTLLARLDEIAPGSAPRLVRPARV